MCAIWTKNPKTTFTFQCEHHNKFKSNQIDNRILHQGRDFDIFSILAKFIMTSTGRNSFLSTELTHRSQSFSKLYYSLQVIEFDCCQMHQYLLLPFRFNLKEVFAQILIIQCSKPWRSLLRPPCPSMSKPRTYDYRWTEW